MSMRSLRAVRATFTRDVYHSGRLGGPMPPLVGMDRVKALKIFGVRIFGKLKATTHVDEVLASCAGYLYAPLFLRAHGLDEYSSASLRPSTASCMLVRHGGVMLTKQIGPGLAGSSEDCSRLVPPSRQKRTSTPQLAHPNSNCSTGSH